MSKLPPPTIHEPRGDLPVLLSVPHSGRDYPDWLVALAGGRKGRASRRSRTRWSTGSSGEPCSEAAAQSSRGPRARRSIATGPRTRWIPRWSTARGAPGSALERAAVSALCRRGRSSTAICGEARSAPSSSRSGSARRHRPYHEAIEAQLALLMDRFGCALLLDCHSMPPPPDRRLPRSCSAIAAARPPTNG